MSDRIFEELGISNLQLVQHLINAPKKHLALAVHSGENGPKPQLLILGWYKRDLFVIILHSRKQLKTFLEEVTWASSATRTYIKRKGKLARLPNRSSDPATVYSNLLLARVCIGIHYVTSHPGYLEKLKYADCIL